MRERYTGDQDVCLLVRHTRPEDKRFTDVKHLSMRKVDGPSSY